MRIRAMSSFLFCFPLHLIHTKYPRERQRLKLTPIGSYAHNFVFQKKQILPSHSLQVQNNLHVRQFFLTMLLVLPQNLPLIRLPSPLVAYSPFLGKRSPHMLLLMLGSCLKSVDKSLMLLLKRAS